MEVAGSSPVNPTTSRWIPRFITRSENRAGFQIAPLPQKARRRCGYSLVNARATPSLPTAFSRDARLRRDLLQARSSYLVGVPIPEQNRSCSGFLFVKYFLRISLCCHYTKNAAVFIGNRRRLLEIGTDHQTIRIVSNC